MGGGHLCEAYHCRECFEMFAPGIGFWVPFGDVEEGEWQKVVL
ncbi:MAG: hypothetical protein NZ706_01065 [Candidatus Caldatribacterium sp.]|nr:hypothetical protein [Candidatus Caldatribacterium sp.]